MVFQMMKKVLLIMLFLYSLAEAQELEGTRGIGLSGALRGTVGLNESIYYNPSAFAFSQRYSIEAQSFFLPSQKGEPSRWVYSGSVVDSHNEFFAAGLGYYRKTKEGREGKEAENGYHLALSKILAPYWAMGVTGKYIHINRAISDKQLFNMDIGNFLVLTPAIQVGLTGHNILGSHEDIPGKIQRKIGLGARIQTWKFLYTSIDALKVLQGDTTQNVSLHSALEVVHENGVVFQSGFSMSDQSSQNLYGFGMGWSQYKFGAFYAFQNSMDSLRRNTHALSLRVFF
ncbi:MAG: hypothetical protein A2Z91_04510 [Deltaproteobacteria bacterium GWA2_38_16]|nr:MAG: hypothetical protein A2Z91_04510 [Deltaproteobacteria bacterium GWA2_38_16]OGQ01734.1 MAG: hypothetical protein A3D19_07670 [Deltaproteobacteria bacterium RIFCSPHIGHO2_02_FULL_38_15]OGQ62230.1 MAG: hypothetical protein A3G92_08115 [Deltaproteobacteria bacterium RIFCSPLOWO2_12_FULL_38_8]HBQ21463.1 hypothetical protein [Deltaproteobacteria bacterium]